MSKMRVLVGVLAIGLVAATTAAGRFYSDSRVAARQLKAQHASQSVVSQFFSLPRVAWPSEISPYYIVRSTEDFTDAPIQVVEFADPLCSDCRVLFLQLEELKREFAGKLNVVYQFFPLEAKCNGVVEKDKHPGACDLSYALAADTARFAQLYDEVFRNMDHARFESWRENFFRRHGVEAALTDNTLHARVQRLIATGTEYERTSEKYSYGIRSTPTMIVNGRMIIGTLPLHHMRAIFQALLDASELKGEKYLESWLKSGCAIADEAEIQQCS